MNNAHRGLEIAAEGVRTAAVGPGRPLAVIAGPCVLESVELGLRVGEHMASVCEKLGLGYVFKASFDKANRSSLGSPRGPGAEEGLAGLTRIRQELGVPTTTDVHEPGQAAASAAAVDVVQVPAFLCRQTDLLLALGAAAASARAGGATAGVVNIKKGQFLSPAEMAGPVAKVRSTGCDRVLVTERGTFFGYHRLVNDFIGLGDLLEGAAEPGLAEDRSALPETPGGGKGGSGGGGGGGTGVVFDATHSVQMPGVGSVTGGRRDRVGLLARAAVAAGVDAVFLETHPDPDRALSDGSNMLPLGEVEGLLATLARVREAVG